MSSTQPGPAAVAAREAHRDPTGRFGAQPAPESATTIVTGPSFDPASQLRPDHGMDDWELDLAEDHELPIRESSPRDRAALEAGLWSSGRESVHRLTPEQLGAALRPVRLALYRNGLRDPHGGYDQEAVREAEGFLRDHAWGDFGDRDPAHESEWLRDGARCLVDTLVTLDDSAPASPRGRSR